MQLLNYQGCQNDGLGCTHWTFDPDEHTCKFYNSCDSGIVEDDSCEFCVTGEERCESTPFALTDCQSLGR